MSYIDSDDLNNNSSKGKIINESLINNKLRTHVQGTNDELGTGAYVYDNSNVTTPSKTYISSYHLSNTPTLTTNVSA
jgi:hypothetical protein